MWRCTSYFYFSNGFWGCLIAWNRHWLEAVDINWLTVFLVLHWFWYADPCVKNLYSDMQKYYMSGSVYIKQLKLKFIPNRKIYCYSKWYIRTLNGILNLSYCIHMYFGLLSAGCTNKTKCSRVSTTLEKFFFQELLEGFDPLGPLQGFCL